MKVVARRVERRDARENGNDPGAHVPGYDDARDYLARAG